jgi:hypothetical protein
MDLEDAAREAAGNWQEFDSFAWYDAPDEYTHNRDSGVLERCNAEAIAAALEALDTEDVKPESHNHWACGYVDGFAIRVYRDGVITEAFKVYHGLRERLADYPVLDESRLSEMEAEESAEAWDSWAWRDFLESLSKRFGVESRDVKPEDVKPAFDSAADDASEYWHEDGGSMYIDVRRVAGAMAIDDALPFLETALRDGSAHVVAGLLAELQRLPEAGSIGAAAGLGGAQVWALADELETEDGLHPQSANELAALLRSLENRPEVCATVCRLAGVSPDQFASAADELELIGRILDK